MKTRFLYTIITALPLLASVACAPSAMKTSRPHPSAEAMLPIIHYSQFDGVLLVIKKPDFLSADPVHAAFYNRFTKLSGTLIGSFVHKNTKHARKFEKALNPQSILWADLQASTSNLTMNLHHKNYEDRSTWAEISFSTTLPTIQGNWNQAVEKSISRLIEAGQYQPSTESVNKSTETTQNWFSERIAVLPLYNKSQNDSAHELLRQLAADKLKEGGYTVVSLNDIDATLNELGYMKDGRLKPILPKKLAEQLSTDKLLFGKVDKFQNGLMSVKMSVWSKSSQGWVWNTEEKMAFDENIGPDESKFINKCLESFPSKHQ